MSLSEQISKKAKKKFKDKLLSVDWKKFTQKILLKIAE